MKKTIIITGAGKGIGKAISLALAKEGHNLVVVGRNETDLKQLTEECNPYPCEISAIVADLARPESAGIIVNSCIEQFAGVDVLINNAGVANPYSVENTPLEQWDLMMAVNARAPYLLCKKALPYLKQSQQATIINISSVVGRKGYVNQSAYSASKHALTGFTKALAREVQNLGIRVHLLAPGGVATEMLTRTRPDLNSSGLIKPEEIANIVCFLINTRGNMIIDEINIRRPGAIPFD